ncbi:MAG: M1 family metallopeptidase [Roseivirga sp.]|nr:M1 family metallopeptidase [Roseivirga sp.]
MRLLSVSLLLLLSVSVQAQFTKADSLRGSITPERSWWDLTYYHLDIEVDPETRFIKGSNTVQYEVLEPYQRLQIDLQAPLKITSVTQHDRKLEVVKEGSAHFIKLIHPQQKGQVNEIVITYEGNPRVSPNPPWSGGLTWQKDSNDKHFIATSCQGDGASLWWPNKDHMYDEVDSMLISVTVPDGLMNVSNGRLRKVDRGVRRGSNNTINNTWHWFVSNPINNYGVNINIGDYVEFNEVYKGEKGDLDCVYYVLRDNLDKAKEQFKQVGPMMKAFEHWFGPYPFYEDSYKLVEVPYLGMEHQSSVTYGNDYGNGYRGTDLSGSGWGLKFDFIIIHESGHEWFANNITNKDIADMWIHESFTAYSENLYLDYLYGKEASADYVIGTRQRIQNNSPIIGPYGVNKSGSGDMYYKGANMLHTIRQIIDNDELWRNILRGLNETFFHQTVDTDQIESYVSNKSGIDFSKVFDQYLRDKRIPKLQYTVDDNKVGFQWINSIEGFDMPVYVDINGKKVVLKPTTQHQVLDLGRKIETFSIDRNFYIEDELIKK